MATRVITDHSGIDKLASFLGARKLPVTVTVTAGAGRRPLQNRLVQRWFSDVSRQLGDHDREYIRADCKVTFGVPILRAENEAFCLSWDESFGQLNFEAQRRAVKNLDVPVTRLMTVKQMTAFMDAMQQHWAGIGIRLTDPEALKYEEEFV